MSERPFSAPKKGWLYMCSVTLQNLQFVPALFATRWLSRGYLRPSDFRYFFDFLSPILDAFFFTVSSDRPNRAVTLAVGLFGKSLLSKATSLFGHKPLATFFFVIAWLFSLNRNCHLPWFMVIRNRDIIVIKEFLSYLQKIVVLSKSLFIRDLEKYNLF